jgi:hypothetical protein
VARIAKNCVNDTKVTEQELLVCVAKELGVNWLALKFETVEDVLSLDYVGNAGAVFKLVDDLPKGKRLKISRIKIGFTSVLSVFGNIINVLGNITGIEFNLFIAALIKTITDVEIINIDEKAKKDRGKDKDEKELCDCSKSGKGNGWENQTRGSDGRFV